MNIQRDNFFSISKEDVISSAGEIGKKNIRGIPISSGVYFFVQSGTIRYVGQSVNLYKRISGHPKMKRDKMEVAFVRIYPEYLNIAEYFFCLKFTPSRVKRKPDVDIMSVLHCFFNFNLFVGEG